MRDRSCLLMFVAAAVVAGCGEAPAGSGPVSSETAPPVQTAAPATSGSASPAVDTACGNAPVTAAMLSEAQFAFVGTVTVVDDVIHPWTTDPENADRPEVPTGTPWVTFDVERWYLNDWGTTFAVWMPDIDVRVGDRVAVGGNAYHTQVAGFSGQSGEVELCSRVPAGETSPPAWDERLGLPFAPSHTAPSTTTVLAATKRFGERPSACAPTRLNNGVDDQHVLVAGVACFLAEHDAGRPVVWDVLVPTVEGDPIIARYDDDGTTVTITTDYSFDKFGSGGVIEERCADVVATNWLPAGVDCTTATGEGFQPDSF